MSASDGEARPRLLGLLGLTSRLSEPLSLEEIARVVVDQAQAAAGARTVLMWSVDDPPTHATLVRFVGVSSAVAIERYQRLPLEPWLPMGDAILRREPLFFESRADYRDRYSIAEEKGRSLPFGDISYACLPLVVHGRAIGGFSVMFEAPRVFDQDERMFLTVFAHHAAQALERANLFVQDRAARKRSEQFSELTAALSSAVTVVEIARVATRIGAEGLELATAIVWSLDEKGDLRLLASHGAHEPAIESFRQVPASSELTLARAIRERTTVHLEGDEADDAMGRALGFRSYGAIPLVREDRVLGVIAFGAGEHRHFDTRERAFMRFVAEHCADAIARARLYDDARQMEHRLMSVLERLPIGVLVSRAPDSSLVFANDALARIWRTDKFPTDSEERCRMLKAMYPDGRPMPREASPVLRALAGEIVEGVESRIERRDGTIGSVRVSATPVRRSDGTVELAVATFVDITVEKEALAAADDAGRAKDEFLAMLGHELRNPLAPIVTALHLMRMRGAGNLERERGVIERQVNHLMRLVDDMLDVSRAARGSLRLERLPVEISAIVADAIELAGPLVEERHQKLTVSVPKVGLAVDADRGRLTQVVTNLLNNAAKYTPTGGQITLSARADGDHVSLEVADNGRGIAPDLLPRVFEAFTQGRQGLDRKTGGLGLGLAIARQLIVGHEGTIEARSAGPGRGTVIVVRLPCARLPLARDAASVASGADAGRVSRRVLVVDDNPDAAALLAAALADAGHEVRVAGDGPSALQTVESYIPEIAFVDVGLPVMDGYELAGHLRRVPSLAKTPLVAVTGYVQEGDRERAHASGFIKHLTKPVALEEILECIEQFSPTQTATRTRG
jgi:signal transduction histidine kinase/ActR/RegA family two-component response regulator/transcriptional regulator with GAF, ATPase, and Fis domain